MLSKYTYTVTDRFLRYVTIDTQSDPESHSSPSTEKQKDLSHILVRELHEIGIANAELDDFGYVYATIPSTTNKPSPVICFCSHVDTAPDCSGFEVKPQLHKNYSGEDIKIGDQLLQIATSPYLEQHLGKNIITASGSTLLGGDDKSGVAVIMDLANYLVKNPEIPHGEVRILFTPDEEVGRGTENVDLVKLGADFAYTLDGGDAGSLEDESFNADSLVLTIHGVIAHPGYAKGKLVNALKLAGEILAALPKDRLSPESTDGADGFVHPVGFKGIAEKAEVSFILRSFKEEELDLQQQEIESLAEEIVKKYPGARIETQRNHQYRNMKPVLNQYPQVVALAQKAIELAGLKVKKESIRGGTDGSKLSHLGLPTANIFTGMQNIHSTLEWIGVADMEKSVETLVHLVKLWAEEPVVKI